MNFWFLGQNPGALYRKYLQKWLIPIAETLGDGRHPLGLISLWNRKITRLTHFPCSVLPLGRWSTSKWSWRSPRGSGPTCRMKSVPAATSQSPTTSSAGTAMRRAGEDGLEGFFWAVSPSDDNAAVIGRGYMCIVSLSHTSDGTAICWVWQGRSMAPSFGPLQVITRWCNKRAADRLPLPGAILRIALNLVGEELFPGQWSNSMPGMLLRNPLGLLSSCFLSPPIRAGQYIEIQSWSQCWLPRLNEAGNRDIDI